MNRTTRDGWKRPTTRRTAGAMALVLAAAGAGQAFGYTFEMVGSNNYHWVDQNTSTPGTIDIYYDFRDFNGFTNSVTDTQKVVFQQAMADWSTVTAGKLVFTQNTTAAFNNILDLSVGDLSSVGNTSAPNGVLGIARTSRFPSGVIEGSVVQLDNAETWETTIGQGNVGTSIDFYSVALHEIGHALGLDHTDAPFANIMTSIYRGEKLGPSQDDIAGMNAIYGGSPLASVNAVTRQMATFTVGPNSAYNYFFNNTFNFSTLAYYVDSGTTTVSGAMTIAPDAEFHQNGGVWSAQSLQFGPSGFTPGLFELKAGQFTAGVITVNNGATLTQSGGTLSTGALQLGGGTLAWTGGTLSITGGGAITGVSSFTVPTAGVLRTTGGLSFGSLTVNGKVLLLANGNVPTVSKVNTLTIAGATGTWSGSVDVGNNYLIVQAAGNKAGALADVRDQINTARNGGNWLGNGITSSSAANDSHKGVFAVDNALLGLTLFNGTQVDANSILIAVTYYGDTNLDRVVNVTDLGVVATYYGQTVVGGIVQGDFNGDGMVNVTDLGMLATGYGVGSGGTGFSLEALLAQFPALPMSAGAVPEPASVLVLGVPAMLLLAMRGRKRAE